MRIDNEDIYEKYKKSVLAEATTGMRRKAQIIEDRIDDFFDEIEKKIGTLVENPVFQNKAGQMLADATKEHAEFIMALKQICSTIDSGGKVIPNAKAHAKEYGMGPGDQMDPQQGAAGQSTEPAIAGPGDGTGVAEAETYDGKNPLKGDSIPHIKKVYTGSYKIVQSPSTTSWYVMGQTSNDNPEFVPVTTGFPDKSAASDYMAKLNAAEVDQKQMMSMKWNEKYLKKNNEYRPNEM